MKTLLLIGTRKGAFVAESDAARRAWTLKGPFLKGCEVNHVAHLGGGRLAIAGKSSWWGPALKLSDDGGDTWNDAPGAIRFDEGRGHSSNASGSSRRIRAGRAGFTPASIRARSS
jgi:hypothetical protein